ncbi:MAG: Lrp/AsnC ligand binding domain-containing protein [Halodesulfurarchaeum sp.]
MVHAFIMIRTGAGTSQEVRRTIEDLESVEECHVVAGEFDIIAEADGEEVYDVLSTSSADVQGVAGVEETKTYVSLSG